MIIIRYYVNKIGNSTRNNESSLSKFYKKKNFENFNNNSNNYSSKEKLIESEILLYKEEACIGILNDDENVNDALVWWNTRSSRYPKVFEFAKTVLCIPASSASSERVFSHAGLTVSDLRSSLKAENVEKLVFLHDSRAKIDELINCNKRTIIDISS